MDGKEKIGSNSGSEKRAATPEGRGSEQKRLRAGSVSSESESDSGGPFDELFCSNEYIDDFSDDDSAYIAPQTKVVEYPFTVLRPDEVTALMDSDIDNAQKVTALPKPLLPSLLRHFKWSQECLLEALHAQGDGITEQVFTTACVLDPKRKAAPAPAQDANLECTICCDTVPAYSMFDIGCGHSFCTSCWKEFITVQVKEERSTQISCLAHNCKIILDDESVEKLAKDPEVQKQYRNCSVNHYVQCQKLVKWCPSPGCCNAIKVDYIQPRPSDISTVTCSCEHPFCFACAQESHEPVPCDILEKWLIKCQDESETRNWIDVHTKPCPRCQTNIEKNGGCNHMKCRNCQYDFCYICLADWASHGGNGYVCNRFNPPRNGGNGNVDTSRAALQRYLHFFGRFKAHQSSLKFEKSMLTSIQKDTPDLTVALNWSSSKVFQDSVKVLVHSRQVLMYSYIFAFYLTPSEENHHVVIFEQNQEYLQKEIEKLSEIFQDNEVNPAAFKDNAADVRNGNKLCKQRVDALTSYVTEGYANDWWTFRN